MGATIKLTDDQSWVAASWVFDHVLRQTIPHIPTTNQRLAGELKESLLEGQLDHLDLSSTSAADKRVFLSALRAGLARTKEEGSEAFSDPQFYPGFIARYQELIDLVSLNAGV
jgi:hypothetical protein